MSVITNLISTVEKNGAAYVVLIDPDRNDENSIQDRVLKANDGHKMCRKSKADQIMF